MFARQRLLLFLILLNGPAGTSQLMAQPSVWGLSAADTFVVETTISKTTSVTLDDAKPVTTQTTETLNVEYRVERLFPTETHFYVRILQADTNDKSATVQARQRMKLLEETGVRLAVDPKGVARILGGYEGMMSRLADRDDTTLKALKTAYPIDAFAAWMTRPFWMVSPAPTTVNGTMWERLDNVSLGTMGTLRTVANLEVTNAENKLTTVSITGQGRLIPGPDQRSPNSSTFTFSDVDVKTEFSGEGKMRASTKTSETEDETPPAEIRPDFKSLTLQWEIEGTAKLKVGTKVLKVSFREVQSQKSRLVSDSRSGTSEPTPLLPGMP